MKKVLFCALSIMMSAPVLCNKEVTMKEELKIGGIYRHYKNKSYKVIGIAHHSETLEPLVIYQALYETPEFGKDALWARPLPMFLETININGSEQPRFALVEDE